MYYTIYENATHFKEETFPMLLKNEAANNLLVGNILRLEKSPIEGSFMATVKDEAGNILVIAVHTPPFNLCLYTPPKAKAQEALQFLAKTLYEKKISIPGVIGEDETVETFSLFYCTYTRQLSKIIMRLNAYKLTTVNAYQAIKGSLECATLDALSYLPYWQEHFIKECHLPPSSFDTIVKSIETSLENERFYIWKDNHPVSMVGKGRQLKNGIVISNVYTPPYFRNQHYATACVGTISQRLLDEGHDFVALFADRDNPVSNKMYEAIGYQLVGYTKQIHFTKN